MKRIVSFLAAAAAAISLAFTGISAGAAYIYTDECYVSEVQSCPYAEDTDRVSVERELLSANPAPESGSSGEEKDGGDFLKKLLISLAAGVVIALIVCLFMKSMMKTARPKRTANDYIRKNSFNITRSRDIFIYANVTKRKREKQENQESNE